MSNTVYEIQSYSYEFTSCGKKGNIKKKVVFDRHSVNVYNFGFGDKQSDGTIDDTVVSNNGDFGIMIKTIIQIVKDFTYNNPERYVYFQGNSIIKMKFYKKLIIQRYGAIIMDYNIEGVVNKKHTLNFYTEPFDKNNDYDGFFINRRKREC